MAAAMISGVLSLGVGVFARAHKWSASSHFYLYEAFVCGQWFMLCLSPAISERLPRKALCALPWAMALTVIGAAYESRNQVFEIWSLFLEGHEFSLKLASRIAAALLFGVALAQLFGRPRLWLRCALLALAGSAPFLSISVWAEFGDHLPENLQIGSTREMVALLNLLNFIGNLSIAMLPAAAIERERHDGESAN